MKNSKIEVSFENRILHVIFKDDATIEASDLKEIYEYGNQKSEGNFYGVIFESINHYNVTEEAIDYIINNPYSKNILAKAYVVNTKEAEMKTRAHLAFDHPALKPFTFKTLVEAKYWLQTSLIDK
jgi:hypothetical protein